MWYVLFNVLIKSQSIFSALFEVGMVYKLSLEQRWQIVILSGIFPDMITDIITVAGRGRIMRVLLANISSFKVE